MAGSSVSCGLGDLLGTGCTILLLSAVPVAQVTVGVVYLDECPAAPAIPVYMMVCGISALLLMGLLALPRILCPGAESNAVWTMGVLSLILFIFIWFLHGSYQIYSVYPPNYDKNTTGSVSSADLLPDPAAPPTMDNQSLPRLNHTWLTSSIPPFRKLTQSSALSSRTSEEQTHLITAEEAFCHRSMYLFALSTTTLAYVLIASSLFMVLCMCVFTRFVEYVTSRIN